MGLITFNPLPVEVFGATNELQEMGLRAIAESSGGPDIDTLEECVNASEYLGSVGMSKDDVTLAKEMCYDSVDVPVIQTGSKVVIKQPGFCNIPKTVFEYSFEKKDYETILTVHDMFSNETFSGEVAPDDAKISQLSSDGIKIYINSNHGLFEVAFECGYFEFSRPGSSRCLHGLWTDF